MSEERILRIDIDYKLPSKTEAETKQELEGGDSRTEWAELTTNYLESAVSSSHPNGLEGQQRRIWSRIQRKVDEAIADKAREQDHTREVKLEEAECDFLRKAFEKCKVPSAIAKYFVILEDAIEETTKRIKVENQTEN